MPLPPPSPRPSDLREQRVVVTGASRGLGRAIAAAFHGAGARVALVARDGEALADLRDELGDDRALAVPADVSGEVGNEVAARAAVEAWGGLDVWVANAGVSPVVAGPLATDPADWRHIVDVNLTGVFLGARAAAGVMGRGSRIIATSSVLGPRPRKGLAAYSATKAGVEALVQALALDLAEDGITVNAVRPGWFDSPLTEAWQRSERLQGEILGHTALGRWGAPEELVGAYLYLASPAASFVTGSVLTVDGGYLCV